MWIVYALERKTKKVVSFKVGARNNNTLNAVQITLKLAKAKTIFTDGLKHYKYLIDKSIHVVKRFGTNHIEKKIYHLEHISKDQIGKQYAFLKVMQS